MSDDLIDRLQNPHFDDLQWPKGLFAEAADRIEALEAALTRIVWAEHNAELSSSTMIEMADIAHAALAGEKKDE